MMDNSDAGQYSQNINGSFQDGHNGNPYRVASVNGNSMPDQSNMPSSFTPQSIEDIGSLSPTGNGMSAADKADILTGGYNMGNANGASQQSYNAARYMRFIGDAVV
jgi:hypothetical protein